MPKGKFLWQKMGLGAGSRQIWIAADGSGRLLIAPAHGFGRMDERFSGPDWSTATPARPHLPQSGPWQPYPFGGRQLTYEQMLALPRSAPALLQIAAGTSRYGAFEQLATLLVQPAVPSSLTRAIYQALAGLPGTKNLGTSTVGGRTVAVIGQKWHSYLWTLAIDPKTGETLRIQYIAHGRAVSTVRLEGQGLVDSTASTS